MYSKMTVPSMGTRRPGFVACGTMIPTQPLGPDTDTPGGARLVVVVREPPEESPATLARLARPGVAVVASTGAWADYDVPGSPYVVLTERGTITGEGSASTWPGVRDLLAQAVDERRHAAAHAGTDKDDPGRIDAELAAAGIHPGHPSLHTPPDPDDHPGERPR